MTARDTAAGDAEGLADAGAAGETGHADGLAGTGAAGEARETGGSGSPADAGLAARLARMISDACDGRVTPAEILATGASPGASLSALGVTSLALLRLIDAVEEEFDVVLDLSGGAAHLDSFPLLVGHVAEGTR
ncbi:acyl carrier protein [Streptosporangium sandarakinum]|uniref:acyl carrier protein n=1 Tax=Streptosporangium sandarakinum TaxID=1260955 RepID=UPI0033B29D4A